MLDLLINLLASVIAGTAVWLAQRLVRYRRLAHEQAFFGLSGGAACVLSVARHFASPNKYSVHRRDVTALVELATLARECGARADLATDEELATEFGRLSEFCVGGPGTNPRTATHLRALLPAVTFEVATDTARPDMITCGGAEFRREPGAEYVVLARAWGRPPGKPVFVLAGQSSATNLAAARYLGAEHRSLFRQYGADQRFCLILRVVEPDVYGSDFTEVAADLTDVAFRPLPDPEVTE